MQPCDLEQVPLSPSITSSENEDDNNTYLIWQCEDVRVKWGRPCEEFSTVSGTLYELIYLVVLLLLMLWAPYWKLTTFARLLSCGWGRISNKVILEFWMWDRLTEATDRLKSFHWNIWVTGRHWKLINSGRDEHGKKCCLGKILCIFLFLFSPQHFPYSHSMIYYLLCIFFIV